MKQLAEHLEWKAEDLRGLIGEHEARNDSDAPEIYLRRRELKDGFRLLISKDQEHFHAVQDARELAVAGAEQERRLRRKELKTARRNLARIEQFLKHYEPDDVESLLEQLPKAYRELPQLAEGAGTGNLMSAIPESEMDDRTWMEANTRRNPSHPEHLNVTTSFGLAVRSKSEMLIAEYLKLSGLPFRYEPEIEVMNDGNIVPWYPDFQIRLSSERTVFWEHFGRMDDEDYVERAHEKIWMLISNGLYLGRDIEITMESSASPLDINYVIALVRMLKFRARKISE